MKITKDITVEEVKEKTKDTMMSMCFIGDSKEGKQTTLAQIGISNANQVMNQFMQMLVNNEFKREVEPVIGKEFVPTEELIEKELDSYTKLLHLISNQEGSRGSVLQKTRRP